MESATSPATPVGGSETVLVAEDVVMPGINGRELADRIAERRSDVKVLFVSGYTGEAVHQHGLLEHDVAFLQNLFTPIALARKVREVLDSTKGS